MTTMMDVILAGDSLCSSSAAGWLWYCDEHDTHGQADEKLEAAALSRAHTTFKLGLEPKGTKAEDVCAIYFVDVSNHKCYIGGE